MSDHGYVIKNQYAIHFITFSVVQWVDVFTRKEYADIVVESLNYCRKAKGLRVHAWCIMSNHLHLIISTQEPSRLSDVLRDFKKYTSGKVINAIAANARESRQGWMLWIFRQTGKQNSRNKEFQFWQQDNHPIECTKPEILSSTMRYLHENPLKAGLVRCEQDYVYSSAIDYYCNGKGLIEIDFV